jgi:hypothetical protein
VGSAGFGLPSCSVVDGTGLRYLERTEGSLERNDSLQKRALGRSGLEDIGRRPRLHGHERKLRACRRWQEMSAARHL